MRTSPSTDTPARSQLSCDSELILRVFSNLIGNAIKVTPAGGTVRQGAAPCPEGIRFSVRDDGPGIAKEHQAKIFERFWQVPRAKRRGSGLGLFISRGIVEAHAGEIWVESTEGRGSTFYFTLPAAGPTREEARS